MHKCDDIPNELWIEIVNLLEPEDILSFSGTCKLLRELLSQRDIWVDVLHYICRKHALFPPSYPVDEMDLIDLQRAALGPYRWRKMVQDNANPPATTLEPISKTWAGSGRRGTHLHGRLQHLVPGGRFMITAGFGYLVLWDLGIPVRPVLAPRIVIARAVLNYNTSVSIYSVRCIADDKLRVCVISEVGGVVEDRIKTFDISLGEQDPAFHKVFSYTGAYVPHMYLNGNHLLFTRDGQQVIEDIVLGRQVPWPSQSSLRLDSLTSTQVFAGDFFFEFTPDALLVWATPSANRSSASAFLYTSTHTGNLPPLSPDYTFPWPIPVPHNHQIKFLVPWSGGYDIRLPFIFDIFLPPKLVNGESPTIAARFKVDMVQGLDNHPQDITLELQATFTFPLPCAYSPRGSLSHGFGTENLAVVESRRPGAHDWSGTYFLYTLIPAPHTPSAQTPESVEDCTISKNWTVLLTRIGADTELSCSTTCPASGRSVDYRVEPDHIDSSRRYVSGVQSRYILDYFSPVHGS